MKKYIFCIMVVFGLSLGACNDWLDVPSKTEVIDYEMFKTEQGFMDGMAGVYYLMCRNELYGDMLSITFLDILARRFNVGYYHVDELGKDLNEPGYYAGAKVKPVIDGFWKKGYNVIANVNSLLEQIEEYKSVFTYDNYRLIKGEALGVRAFMHFDLMRMFGKPYEVAGDELTIPYVTQLSGLSWPLFSTEDDVMKYALRDLQEADSLLAVDNMYTSSLENSWVNSRRSHFNRWAVYATMARIYHWKGDTEKALLYANKVIESQQFEFFDPQKSAMNSRDLPFYSECIFTLDKYDLKDVYEKRMRAQTLQDYLANDVNDITSIYETEAGGSTDYRFTWLWSLESDNYSSRYVYFRYNASVATEFPPMITLMRLSEMYYIAAECCGNTEKGRAYLNEMRVHRGLSKLPEGMTDEIFQNEIFKEYQKEFFCEGQLFYYYKRLNQKVVLDHDNTTFVNIETPGLVFPVPEDELELRTGVTKE
ncbi:RagB/SusD family nutrient uptake outer membrane protein [Butyricimonas sp.]|uniref:RagB/SusD family nutrient uptake outer membrane protein n=1 Tax=Butyricimonas sp. TaxID=1969738 RepID=UPI0025B836EA|nr:RagB/SusD family nutrient uptake outer membrane protein [Butyricimonas sp.]